MFVCLSQLSSADVRSVSVRALPGCVVDSGMTACPGDLAGFEFEFESLSYEYACSKTKDPLSGLHLPDLLSNAVQNH